LLRGVAAFESRILPSAGRRTKAAFAKAPIMSRTDSTPRFRRRSLWINPAFQLRLLAAIWTIVVAAMSVAAVATVFYFAFFHKAPESAVVQGWTGALGRAALALLILLVLLVWASVRVTHRIAGPVYRVLRTLERLTLGDLPSPSIRFRRGDAFPEVAEHLNQAIDALRREREEGRRRLDALSKELE